MLAPETHLHLLQTLLACVGQWRSAVDYTHELEDRLAVVLQRWQNMALGAAFSAFKANADKQRLRKLVSLLSCILVTPPSTAELAMAVSQAPQAVAGGTACCLCYWQQFTS